MNRWVLIVLSCLFFIGIGSLPDISWAAEADSDAESAAAARTAEQRFRYYSDRIDEFRRTYAVEKEDAIGNMRFSIDLFEDVIDSIGNYNYEERYRTSSGSRQPVQARIIPERTSWESAAGLLSNLLLEIGSIADVGPWGPVLDILGVIKGDIDEALLTTENPWRPKKEVEDDKRELNRLIDQAEKQYRSAFRQAYCDSGLAALDVQVWNLRRCEIPNDASLMGDSRRSGYYRSTLSGAIDDWRKRLSFGTSRGLPLTRNIPRVVRRVCEIQVPDCPQSTIRRPGIQR